MIQSSDNKNIFVTGGSRGIGKSIVDFFKSKGHYVYSPNRNEFNLENLDSINSMDEFNFDVIVNCAGINELMYFSDESFEYIKVFNKTMNVNLLAPISIIQRTIPYMIKNGYGRIVNIGSILQTFSKKQRSIYSMSKSALHSLTKSIAVEYGEFNILCNTISPGYIDTELTRKNNTQLELDKIAMDLPTKRLGTPEEVAKLCYQMTIENTFITGQNIIIDGGFSCIV